MHLKGVRQRPIDIKGDDELIYALRTTVTVQVAEQDEGGDLLISRDDTAVLHAFRGKKGVERRPHQEYGVGGLNPALLGPSCCCKRMFPPSSAALGVSGTEGRIGLLPSSLAMGFRNAGAKDECQVLVEVLGVIVASPRRNSLTAEDALFYIGVKRAMRYLAMYKMRQALGTAFN